MAIEYPGPFIAFASSPWQAYLDCGMKRSYPAQAALLHPEEKATHLFFVERGSILTTYYFSEEDSFKINVLGENTMAGILEAFSPLPVRTAWHTLSPCQCYLFSREQLENSLPKHLLTNLLEQAALLATTMAHRFSQGKRNDVRLARFLLHFAQANAASERVCGSGISITPNVTQQICSELLGMHPVTYNKLLAAFRRSGIVGKSKQSSLEILDVAALERYAKGDVPDDAPGDAPE